MIDPHGARDHRRRASVARDGAAASSISERGARTTTMRKPRMHEPPPPEGDPRPARRESLIVELPTKAVTTTLIRALLRAKAGVCRARAPAVAGVHAPDIDCVP